MLQPVEEEIAVIFNHQGISVGLENPILFFLIPITRKVS
jgi:hypothetical protein